MRKQSVKLQYEAPQTLVVKLHSQQMMAASPGGLGQPNPYPSQPDPLGF
ncbi:MAG: hypothetical protein IJR87_10545 [Bacteroidaceae bacterium]|nr:hypothetical protein [Bacteroidaceae bacterium]